MSIRQPDERRATDKAPIHVAMRFNDKLFGVGNVIERHEAVVAERGAVWVAKLGRPLARSRILQLNKQLAAGIDTYLFLSQKTRGQHEVWRSHLLDAREEIPATERRNAPAYYEDLHLFESETWFKVSSFDLMDKKQLDRIITVSSRQRVMRTLTSSIASMFIVAEDPRLSVREPRD